MEFMDSYSLKLPAKGISSDFSKVFHPFQNINSKRNTSSHTSFDAWGRGVHLAQSKMHGNKKSLENLSKACVLITKLLILIWEMP